MSVEEIYQGMMADFARRTGLEASGAGDLAVRMYAVAAELYSLQVQSDWVARQCFPQTATGEYLDRHAALRGLERRRAAKAEGSLRFSVDEALSTNLTIPAGTVCMTAGLVRFETAEDGVLAAGTLQTEVPARAVEPGFVGNVGSGTVLSMAVAPVGVSRVTNPEPFAGGVDEEGDEALRERVLETFQRLPNGANAAFYQQGALSFPGVAAAQVLPRSRGVGTVDVVIATEAGLPDADLLSQVRAWFEKRREIAVDVAVLAPKVKTVDVTVRVKSREGRDAAAVRRAVTDALNGWFTGARLGKDLLRAQLGGVVFGVEGVENYAIAAPAADVAVAADELPRLGALTVEEMA